MELTNEKSQSQNTSHDWILYFADVTMDVMFSTVCYDYTSNISMKYVGLIMNGIVDGVIDVFQTSCFA